MKSLFRTVLKGVNQKNIGLNKWLLVGSCFTEHIGQKLIDSGHHTCINPHGIIYNPMSIAQSLTDVLHKQVYSPDQMTQINGLWSNWNFHGSFNDIHLNEVSHKINSSLAAAHQFISQPYTLVLTLGTAWVYRLMTTGQVVANCHKHPNSNFEKKLLSMDEVTTSLLIILNQLLNQTPLKQLIITISPVRHLADGFTENQLSKSVLFLSMQQIREKLGDKVLYFPAYEALMDDLRDYRFYAKDMLHPSDQAIDYIWDLFAQSYFDENQLKIMTEIIYFKRSKAHRLLFPDSEESKTFKQKLDQEAQKLKSKYPEWNV